MWDESGVTFAQGENVNEAWRKSTLTWAEIEKRLRELIELGQYLPQGETEKAVAAYNHYVASRAAGRWWDGMQNASIPYISEKTSGYPSVVQAFEAVLDDSEKTVAVADSFSKVIKEIPDRHFYRYGYGSEFVSMLLQTFKRDPVEYPQIDVVKQPMLFLSGDQIDNFLISRGSGISDGKMRIYSFFLREKDNVVRAKFLSDEYGIGGSADDRHNDNHDSKGLALSGGLDSYGKFSVLLKWKQVADHIDTLIRKDRYLTAKEVEHLDAYEKDQIARRIVNFYYGKSAEAPRPYVRKGKDYSESDAEKEVYQQLGDARRVNEIVGMMQTVFDSEMPGSRTYDHDRKCLADVRRFAEGKYNLFPGSKYRKKEQVTEVPRVIQPIETGREESPLDIDYTQYGLNLKLGDWLHIGQNEVQLSSATAEGVELYDGTLFPMEMTLEVFVRRVKENPLNEAFLLKESEKVVNEPMPAPVAPDEPEQADRHEIAAYALGAFTSFSMRMLQGPQKSAI